MDHDKRKIGWKRFKVGYTMNWEELKKAINVKQNYQVTTTTVVVRGGRCPGPGRGHHCGGRGRIVMVIIYFHS